MSEAVHPKVNAIKIFLWLAVLTAAEVGVVYLHLSPTLLAALLVGTAVVKAVLVASFFMHLKFEGKLILWMVGGTMILAAFFLLMIWPDIVGDPWAWVMADG
ncbi:MAG: caa(3)-type oxidase subunit IV [Planctomycetes bacterium]|jgi:cytochrome c oxidase subunit 4|nr:caa(3)-type oxidase subunit IV [Planctomycetota bacterium]HJO26114.1 cytochrome C oxidase subunit IV family protein [Planctomycetota bacterium]